jgi:hypothetical protein
VILPSGNPRLGRLRKEKDGPPTRLGCLTWPTTYPTRAWSAQMRGGKHPT